MTLFTRAGTHGTTRHSTGGVARSSGRWVAMVVAVAAAPLAATAVAVLPSGTPAGAAGTPVISETFQNSNVAAPSSWVTPPAPDPETNLACLTAGDNTAQTPIPDCSSSGSANGAGVLRLTDANLSEEGGVLTSLSVPASSGLDANFNSYQYGGSSSPADGIGFVISAENPADPVAPASIGEPGGDLGYSAVVVPGAWPTAIWASASTRSAITRTTGSAAPDVRTPPGPGSSPVRSPCVVRATAPRATAC